MYFFSQHAVPVVTPVDEEGSDGEPDQEAVQRYVTGDEFIYSLSTLNFPSEGDVRWKFSGFTSISQSCVALSQSVIC